MKQHSSKLGCALGAARRISKKTPPYPLQNFLLWSFTREATNKWRRCQESKGSFQVDLRFFFSFFKRPELFKAGLLLLEILLVQMCPTSALLSFAWCEGTNDSGPLKPCT